ncbi:MAG: hypothetical protein PHN79_00985, partial [Methanoregula sp.]|nr:hypothetical protein [Methanoregula sp.]
TMEKGRQRGSIHPVTKVTGFLDPLTHDHKIPVCLVEQESRRLRVIFRRNLPLPEECTPGYRS